MTVRQLVSQFPEIPEDLHDDPLLARFAEELDPVLRDSRQPGPCSKQHDRSNHYYLKLIGPIAIYGYGLKTRERLFVELQELIDHHHADPQGFAASLLPKEYADREIRGPGCN